MKEMEYISKWVKLLDLPKKKKHVYGEKQNLKSLVRSFPKV